MSVKNNKTIEQELQHCCDACKDHPNYESHLAYKALVHIQNLNTDIFLWKGFTIGVLVALLWVVGSGK